jgi:hypothetical protein
MPGVATAQLLTYAEVVDVDLDATNDVNFADVEDYGHRVQIEVDKSALNNYLRWSRAVGSARPSAALDSTKESAFKDAINAGLAKSYSDIDGVTGGLHFGTANLNTNPDPRKRSVAGVSANDLPLCFVLYKLYGSSAVATLDNIYNLADAMGMLSNETVSTAITESFKAQVSGALDTMFRDLLSSDPHRFFDASGIPEAGIFETNADVSGAGAWKITDDDILEVKLKMIFHSRVSRRGVAGREHNLTSTATEDAAGAQENQQTVINPEDYFYVRLQMKAKDMGLADPAFLTYDGTRVTGYTGPLVNATLAFPDGVTAIDGFSNKTGLKSIIVPASVVTIGDGCFSGCRLEGVINLPGVKTIYAFAFQGNPGITGFVTPVLEELRQGVFRGTAITSLDLSMVKRWPDSGESFQNTTTLTSVTMPTNPTNFNKAGGGMFSGATGITSVTFPSSVTTIGDGAFANASGLTSVIAPGVTSVEANAFINCVNLSTVQFGTLTSIGGGAFQNTALNPVPSV